MTTWRKLISKEMEKRGESWSDVESVALAKLEPYYGDEDEPRPEPSLDAEFNDGFGGAEGCWFTLWTRARVYFPAVYDGAEWCESVPRHPCEEAKSHVGGS